jgi:hypothetical protein
MSEIGRGVVLRLRNVRTAMCAAAAAAALFAAPASAQVQLSQHCDFGGWQANFTTGNFDTAAIVARGGLDNDASSIRVAPGFRVTLFTGNNQTGRSAVVTGDTACFVDLSFNDVLSSMRVEAVGGGDVVQLFQHCDFTGWQANFPEGSFNTAALVGRGGVDNDASSIRVAAGFKATLFDGANLSGRSVEVRGNTACFVGINFNDVLSSLRIEREGAVTPTPTPTGQPTATPTPTSGPTATPTPTTPPGQCVPGDEIEPTNPPTPPTTIGDWIGGHNTTMTRFAFDRHVVIYADDQVTVGNIGWVPDIASRTARYMKKTYDPDFTYGPDRIFVFLHQGRFGGGTISSYFDAFSNFRNATDAGSSNWGVDSDNRIARDILTHEFAHIVEGSSNGVHESPAFEQWSDSKWAEFFQYDLYKALGLEQDATRVFNRFMASRDNFPAPNTAWFRDWFHPMWVDGGGTCNGGAVMGRFFRLLKDHFPKVPENGGRNLTYARRMNLGEFVHFSSGAAGKNLSGRAMQAFSGGFQVGQFEQARRDFPGVTYP